MDADHRVANTTSTIQSSLKDNSNIWATWSKNAGGNIQAVVRAVHLKGIFCLVYMFHLVMKDAL